MRTQSFAVLPQLKARPLFLVLMAAAFPALAAQADEAQVVLDKVIVEATPFKRGADDLVQPVDVLQGAELERKRRATLGETLEGELGVSTSDFGPGVGRPIIRGQGGPRVLVLDNGLSTMDAASVSNDHAVTLDPQHATQVEIIKGPATLIYGSAASAGVINVVDERLPEQVTPGFSGEAGLAYGENANELTTHVDLDYGIGQTQLHADFAQRDTGRFSIPGNSALDGSGEQGRVPNSAVESQSGDLSLTRVGERGFLGGSVSFFKTTYGIPAEEEAYIDLDQLRFDLKGRLHRPLPGFESLRLRFGATDYKHTEFEAVGEPGTRFKNTEQELRLEAQHAPVRGFHGVIGLQVTNRDFEAIGDEAFIPPVNTQQIGLFAVEELRYDWGRIEGGLRVEQVDHDPKAATGLPTRSETPISVSLGALYLLSADYHLRASLSRSERAPSAEEYFAFGPHLATATFERGSLGLGKETVNSIEIGIDKHRGRFTWRANAYYEAIQDYVSLTNADCNADAGDSSCNPDGAADFVTAEGVFIADPENPPLNGDGEPEEGLQLVDYRQLDARFTGIEGEAAYKLLTGRTKVSTRIFGDLVRAELDGGGNLPRITPPRYGVGLDASQAQTRFNLSYTRIARQDRVAALETETAGYNLLAADLSQGFTVANTEASVYISGRNLLDEEARRHTSFLKEVYPIAGRSVFVGVNVKF